jgi:hypothetical protein
VETVHAVRRVGRAVALLLLVVGPGARAAWAEPPACALQAEVFLDGRAGGPVCVEAAAEQGLFVVDLSDDWVPRVLAEPADASPELRQPYRQTYLALADERPADLPAHQRFERNLELYGILPTLRVLRARVLDGARNRCDEGVDDTELQKLDRPLSPWAPDLLAQRKRMERMRDNHAYLERARKQLGLASIDQLDDVPMYARSLATYRRDHRTVASLEALQGHLACARLLSGRYERGVFGEATSAALGVWQHEQALISDGTLDQATSARLVAGSRELAFRAALRVLRERVVDALAMIEDGSATGRFGQVLGRDLDSPELLQVRAYGALEGGAEDLVSPATEAAARGLGWTDPEALERFFGARDESATRRLLVALRLPAPPAYYAADMELRAEIDRGDVWYAYPYDANGSARHLPVEKRPTLVLYAKTGESLRPLVRLSTTIGGWQPEQLEHGIVGLRYKESPVGQRVWSDLVAAPVWLPPPSTPDKELLRRDARGRFHFKHDLLGPGYRSAYGLAMLVHLKPLPQPQRPRATRQAQADDLFTDPCCVDEGVRSHGSVSYASILHGYSHGCHRLFNQLALRLMGFLLAHRKHTLHGNMPVSYDRQLEHAGQHFSVHVRSRGYRYELTPPVPVEVLEGRVRGGVKKPIRALQPLPQLLVQPKADTGGLTPSGAQTGSL